MSVRQSAMEIYKLTSGSVKASHPITATQKKYIESKPTALEISQGDVKAPYVYDVPCVNVNIEHVDTIPTKSGRRRFSRMYQRINTKLGVYSP